MSKRFVFYHDREQFETLVSEGGYKHLACLKGMLLSWESARQASLERADDDVSEFFLYFSASLGFTQGKEIHIFNNALFETEISESECVCACEKGRGTERPINNPSVFSLCSY